jgi:hypothetical protein
MATYQTVREYREDRTRYSKQNFLTLHPSPVLLMPNPESSRPGKLNPPAFMTRAQVGTNAPRPPLVVLNDFLVLPVIKGEGHPFPDRIGVGRTKASDISLSDREVSKYHGYFSTSGGQWFFTDAGSSNGTFIRGQRLSQNVATAINDGAEIAFGSGRYVFHTAVGFFDFLLS